MAEDPTSAPADFVEVKLSLIDVLDYIGDSVRPLREGCAVFDAGHVVCIGYKKSSEQWTLFTGYVLQSSQPSQIPHQVDLKIASNMIEWALKCTCKAGTNRCKHIVACLLSLNRVDRVEYLTCTDAMQAWGLSKKGKSTAWGAKRITDLCCVKKPPVPQAIDPELKKKILADAHIRILNVAKHSAFAKHKAGRVMHACPVPQSRVYQGDHQDLLDSKDIFCTSSEILQMIQRRDCVVDVEAAKFQNNEEQCFFEKNIMQNSSQIAQTATDTQTQSTNIWKIHRSRRITASSCYGLHTYLNNKNPNWPAKIERYWCTKNINTAAIKYGKDNERKAFECYLKKRNPLMKKCGLVLKEGECWFAASPDGVDPLSNVLLEIKCPTVGQLGSVEDILASDTVLKYIAINKETGELSLKKSHSYYCQVQMNLWTLQCPTCDFIVYSLKDNDFAVVEVNFDPDFVYTVVNRLKNLYMSKMLATLLPDP